MLTTNARQMHDYPTGRPATEDVRVLIVDDNRSFAELLASALDAVHGIECVGTACSAVEGFQRVADLMPSVVVMDIMMPGLDGLAATTRLRHISPDTAIAVVSAHSQGEWIARAEDAGASAYILKGGSLAELIKVVSAARPGTMVVAPSLQAAWASWERPTPDPASALDKPTARLRLKARRAKRGVARGLTAASQVRRPKPFRW
jgi:DNA-binding NarL/FixJ family response regulator